VISGWLEGPLVLQVEEAINVGARAEERKSSDANALYKVFLTDGRQCIIGIEVVRIPELSFRTPQGSKVILSKVPVRRGVLLLSPANCKLLGGKPVIRDVAAGGTVVPPVHPAVGQRVEALPLPVQLR
jgi:hypothetical protein